MNAILAAIDEEIQRLQSARSLLTGSSETLVKRGRGRPKKADRIAPAKAGRRVMSDEARAKIAAAQKKRWAASKKANK